MPRKLNFRRNSTDLAARFLAEAMTHHQAGRLLEAEQLYRAVLELSPRHADALRLLGALFIQVGKPQEAFHLLHAALREQPTHPEILNNLGLILTNAGRKEEATAYFRRALAANPAYADALNNLGSTLLEQGKILLEQDQYKSALDCYKKAIQVRPNSPIAHLNMGVCWLYMNNLEEALVCFEKARTQKPDYADALANLGVVLHSMDRNAEARVKLEEALQINRNHAAAITNIGVLLHDDGLINEALEHYDRALICAPQCREASFSKSMALLALGRYREGWALYETGLGHANMRGRDRFAGVKPWDGRPAPNKHLLIWHEQGLGDSLQFIRYAELCKQLVSRVSVLCPKPLVRLFKALPFIDDAFDAPNQGSHFDEHVPMMSLPHRFDTVLENVPATVPYLQVDPEVQAKWSRKFVDISEVKIGLVWAGGSHKREGKANAALMDRQRSVGLERMKQWFDLQGARFFNLQKDKPSEQIKGLGLADRLTDFMSEVTDFADTASIVQNLDLVITVDTSVAHLAGGLGKPVWILSRYNADWRWLQNRPTNPWYPTARIFGQPSKGAWDSVMTKVEHALKLEIEKQKHKL